MKISASGEYAVRLLVEFAKYDNFVALKDIAVKQDISIKFAEKIVSRLLKNGILESQRGQDGGYKLAKKPTECTIKEILETTGDCSSIVACIDNECPKKAECSSISVWVKLNGLINEFLDKITLNDLLEKNI